MCAPCMLLHTFQRFPAKNGWEGFNAHARQGEQFAVLAPLSRGQWVVCLRSLSGVWDGREDVCVSVCVCV